MILHAVEKGEGPPVALLHGLFGQSQNFATVQRRLSANHRVLALDLRNHGASPHVRGMRYADMAEDVLETLRSRKALPCALVGHSMGGKTAMTVALAAPAAVERLIVADIAPVAYPSRHGNYVRAMQAIPLDPDLTRAAAMAQLEGVVAEEDVRNFLVSNLRLGEHPRWRLGLEEIADALPALEGWVSPQEPPYAGRAVFVAGARSTYILPEYRDAIRALFPNSRIVTLKNAGHWLHAENPEGFISILENALA